MNRYYISLVFALIVSVAGVQANSQSKLISRYNFEGDYTDHLGLNDLTEHTGASFSAEDKAVGSYALQLDGDSSYAKIEEFAGFPAAGQPWSIAAWIKPTETQTSQWKTVMHVGDREDPTDPFIEFRAKEGHFEGLYYDRGTGNQNIAATSDYIVGQWYHLALTFDGQDLNFYVDGISQGTRLGTPAYGPALRFDVGRCYEGRGTQLYWAGLVDDIRIYSGALSEQEIKSAMLKMHADIPIPHDMASDVLRDVVLSWESGVYAVEHDVYLGTVFDDVNDADRDNPGDVLVSEGQDNNAYEPAGLEFGQTYYWRVDEVNAPPNSTIFKGEVWSFTVEPVGYPIAGEDIIVTASSLNREDEGPENTINKSGLDDDDLHSSENTAMWLTNITDPNVAWIQYEFDRVHKLYQMLVWNYNSSVEPVVGFGIKEATIEYSIDGVDWATLGSPHEFARGPGSDGYAPNTTVDFGGASARYVKITANSNWGGMVNQYGLSEVRFLSIPVLAREPEPEPGATDVDVDATLSWRPGREAALHDVYLSTDEQAVIDGTAPVATVTEPGYAASLDLGSTYYWRIDEVNDAETPTIWQGDIWSLSTQEYLVVDDFESYNDIPAEEEGSNLVYITWVDGFGVATNGSTMGYTEAFQPSMEKTLVYDGSQSAPLFYDNTTAAYSEVTANVADLGIASDWSKHGIKGLTLRFYGDPNNVPQQLYAKINASKVNYDGDAENFTLTGWQMWYIDLAQLGVDISNVTELAIGFEPVGATGGQGMVLLDAIRLVSDERQLITPVGPGTAKLAGYWTFDSDLTDAVGGKDAAAFGDAGFQTTTSKIGAGAAAFDGSGDYMTAGTAGDFSIGTGAMSVSFWLNVADADKENSDRFLNNGAGNNTQMGWTFFMRTNAAGMIGDGVDAGMSDGGGRRIQGTNGNDTIDALDGNWHLLVGVFDYNGGNGKVDIYLDAVMETTIALADLGTWNGSRIDNTHALTFGAIAANPNAFFLNGLLDDVAIWDAALSQDQIDALWNGGAGQAAALIDGD